MKRSGNQSDIAGLEKSICRKLVGMIRYPGNGEPVEGLVERRLHECRDSVSKNSVLLTQINQCSNFTEQITECIMHDCSHFELS